MIPQAKIEEIIRSANIEEVIGDYVRLKRRGTSLTGLCPFHNEKTPSFSVSPAKGVYKCFGCGKAGNVVNFIMEHDSLNYIQALKSLAEKYKIEWPEQTDFNPDENKKQQQEKESLQILNEWSASYFEDILWNSDDGKNIGLTYFEERGFRPEIIRKFRLGYSLDQWDHFTKQATQSAFSNEIILSSGLAKTNENKGIYDAYRNRVIFPIFGLNGKVIAFAGRHLINDPKSPKYVNSPETILYHKSNELYGLNFAKSEIRHTDKVYLVEGYTDVISMHQAGIENVVASSGTSLTEQQIRQIKRFTENVIVLYDGDNAGIKASLRGVDMLLEQGLNVRIVLFPDGEDPDSFSQKNDVQSFKSFLEKEAHDFILFKTKLLYGESKSDPIRKAESIRSIVESIVKIPDAFKRSAFLKECSILLDVSEQLLITESNKLRRSYLKENQKEWVELSVDKMDTPQEIRQIQIETDNFVQEFDILRLLLKYGEKPFPDYISTASFILQILSDDKIIFEQPVYQLIIDESIKLYQSEQKFNSDYFIYHSNPSISKLAATIFAENISISPNWEKRYGIYTDTPEENYINDVHSSINRLKLKYFDKRIKEYLNLINESSDEKNRELHQTMLQILIEKKNLISSQTGTVVQLWQGNSNNLPTNKNALND